MTAALPPAEPYGLHAGVSPTPSATQVLEGFSLSHFGAGRAMSRTAECSRSRCGAAKHQGRLYLFGGSGMPDRFSGGRLRSDVSCVDIATGVWSDLVCTGAAFPSARMHHATCARDGFLVVHGGVDAAGTILSDMWALQLNDPLHEWTKVTLRSDSCTPPALASHACTVSHGCLLLHGGHTNALSPTLYRFTFKTQVLEEVPCANTGPLLQNHTLEVFGSTLYAFGGETYHQGSHEAVNNQLFCCNLNSGVWRAVAFKLRGGGDEFRDFLQRPMLMECVRQTRQLWVVGAGRVYFAALPEEKAEAVFFHTHSHPCNFPEARVHAVTTTVGRALWVMFGEENVDTSRSNEVNTALRLSQHLAEDHVTTRRCFEDVCVYSIDTGAFTSSHETFSAVKHSYAEPTSRITSTQLATPVQSGLHQTCKVMHAFDIFRNFLNFGTENNVKFKKN